MPSISEIDMNRFPPLTLLAGATCLGVAGLFAASAARALSPDWSEVADARLERLFWDCDAQSMRDALSSSEAALCSTAYEELRRRRFDGDFERLHAWWRAHKSDEHARRGLGAAEAAVDVDEAALQAP
jgi:hypothetical protein